LTVIAVDQAFEVKVFTNWDFSVTAHM